MLWQLVDSPQPGVRHDALAADVIAGALSNKVGFPQMVSFPRMEPAGNIVAEVGTEAAGNIVETPRPSAMSQIQTETIPRGWYGRLPADGSCWQYRRDGRKWRLPEAGHQPEA